MVFPCLCNMVGGCAGSKREPEERAMVKNVDADDSDVEAPSDSDDRYDVLTIFKKSKHVKLSTIWNCFVNHRGRDLQDFLSVCSFVGRNFVLEVCFFCSQQLITECPVHIW